LVLLGLIYIFVSVVLFLMDKRQRYISRILRLTKSDHKKDKKNRSALFLNRIEVWLNKNNIRMEPVEFIILVSILSSIIIIIGMINLYNPLVPVLLAVFIVFLIFIVINIRRKKENIKKETQLEQFLLDLKGNLYSNPNLLICLEKTIEDTGFPLKTDFEIVINDTRRGLLLEEALKRMIKRSSSYLIEIILTGLIVADKKGADLMIFIDDQIEYLREKRNIENYIRIISTGPKYTAYIIMLVPILVIIAVVLINREITKILFSGLGLACISYVLVSNAIGIFLINRLVNFRDEGEGLS
jgi:tight adherence protein B